MKIRNPLLVSDWDKKGFALFVFVATSAFIGTIGIDVTILRVGIVRAMITVWYLLFVPGTCILRLLRIHDLGSALTTLNSVGLSISFVMFSVAGYDILSLDLGFSTPLNVFPLTVVISGLTMGLGGLAIALDHSKRQSPFLEFRGSSIGVLLLILVTCAAVWGTLVLNSSGNNLISLASIALIAAVVIVATAHETLDEKLYPFALFTISLALTYAASLLSSNLVEWADGWFEYSAATSVVARGAWIPTQPGDLNSVLSLVTFAPAVSILSGLGIAWTFRLVFPPILSLIPTGLYFIFKRNFSPKISFLSAFFFVSFFSFYTDMLGLNRQVVAELFLVLLVLALIPKYVGRAQSVLLRAMFSIALAVSHYALSYIFIIGASLAVLLLATSRHVPWRRSIITDANSKGRVKPKGYLVSANFVVFYSVIALAWYIYISNASSFTSLVRVANQIQSSILSDFLNPASSQGLALVVSTPTTPLNYVYKTIHLMWQTFVAIGIVVALSGELKNRIGVDFIWLATSFFAMDLAGILVPFFASTTNTSRLFSITLLFVAPFGLIGGAAVTRTVSKIRKSRKPICDHAALQVVGVLLVAYFLFNVGLVHQLAGQPTSFTLDPQRAYRPHFTDADIAAAEWATLNIDERDYVYADAEYAYVLAGYRGSFLPLFGLSDITNPLHSGDFIFLGSDNLQFGTIRLENPALPRLNSTNVPIKNLGIYTWIQNSTCVYDNGRARIVLLGP